MLACYSHKNVSKIHTKCVDCEYMAICFSIDKLYNELSLVNYWLVKTKRKWG